MSKYVCPQCGYIYSNNWFTGEDTRCHDCGYNGEYIKRTTTEALALATKIKDMSNH